MIRNQLWMDNQQKMAVDYYMSPFADKKSKFKYEDVPYPDMSDMADEEEITKKESRKEVKEVKKDKTSSKPKKPRFDRDKAWKEAPEYNLGSLKRLLG